MENTDNKDVSIGKSIENQMVPGPESGWSIRSKALTATQEEDLERGRRVQDIDPSFEPADIRELLRFCGVDIEQMFVP